MYWYYGQSDAREIAGAVIDELGLERSALDLNLAAEKYLRFAQSGPFDVHQSILEALDWATGLNLTLGVVSNGDEAFQMEKLASTGLLPYFKPNLIEVRGSDRHPKPSPNGILACIEREGVKAESVAYVGNRLADVIAANRAKCHSILVESGDFDFKEPSPSLKLERAHIAVPSTSELPSVLRSLIEDGV